MKKLIYIICFGAAVSGFGDMDASMSSPDMQLSVIEGKLRDEKVELLTFDPQKTLEVLNQKKEDVKKLHEFNMNHAGQLLSKQQIVDALKKECPFFMSYKKYADVYLSHSYMSNMAIGIRIAVAILKDAGVQKRSDQITEKDLFVLPKAAEDIVDYFMMGAAGLFEDL